MLDKIKVKIFNRAIVGIAVVLLGIGGYLVSVNYPFNKDILIKEIQREYRGVITSIIFKRTKNLNITTAKDSIITISGLHAELLTIATVGDSIIKIKNKNCCQIIRNGQKFNCNYMHVESKLKLNEYFGEDWERCSK